MNKKQFAVRKWLNRAYNIDYEINTLLRERTVARERMCGVSAAGYGENNWNFDKVIEKQLERLYEIKTEVTDAISAVDNPTYRQLLQLRYIEFCKWERIAEIMNYSHRQIFRLHYKALDSIKI